MPYNPSSNSGNTFSPEDLAHISAVTPIQQVEFHPELASTNDLALEIATRQDYQFPLLVLNKFADSGSWSTYEPLVVD